MAEEKQKQAYPLAPTNGYAQSDAEAGTANPQELRRQKRKKLLLYIAAFVVFQTAIVVLFSLTVMKVKTPKFRARSAPSFNNFDVQPTNPSFAMNMNAQFGVKNTNFGPYKYDSTTVNFYYNDTQVGSAIIPKSKANFLSTKKIIVTVDLKSANATSNANLAGDLNSGILPLTSTSRLSGKVELMLIFKKKKSVNMNCTMDVRIATREIENLKCK